VSGLEKSRWVSGLGAFALAFGLSFASVPSAATGADDAGAPSKASSTRSAKPAKATRPQAKPARRAARAPERPSLGQTQGLHRVEDALDLKSSVALVVDQDTDQVLFSKNSEAVLPIASITKLMTALVVTEAALPAEEALKKNNIRYELYMYDGANHAFHNDTAPTRYNEAAAKLAWQRSIEFFKKYVN